LPPKASKFSQAKSTLSRPLSLFVFFVKVLTLFASLPKS